MSEVEMVHKVTLSSGKVVLLREMKIKHQELAAKAAGNMGGDGMGIGMAVLVQKELLKLLIAKVDETVVKAVQLEDLDSLFTYTEYRQLLEVLNKLTGEDEKLGKPVMEMVSIGV